MSKVGTSNISGLRIIFRPQNSGKQRENPMNIMYTKIEIKKKLQDVK